MEPCAICLESAEQNRHPEPHAPCRSVELFELVGRTILGVFVARDDESICFATDGGVFAWHTSADCCSETWIADITGFEALRGSVVTGVEDMPLVVQDDRCRQESDEFYGIEIRTLRGRAHLAYRNSSNGYYGGNLSSPSRLDAVPDGYREIGEDWSAT